MRPERREQIQQREQNRSIIRRAPSQPVEGVSRGHQRILDALAEMEALGIERPSRVQLKLFAGYDVTGGTGGTNLGALVTSGYVEIPSPGLVRLTDSGRAIARDSSAPRSLDELHQRVLAKVNSGQRRILEHLLAIHPDSIARSDLKDALGYDVTGGTGGTNLGALVTLGAVDIPSVGRVVASDLLFPDSLT
jgi:hypothetical protein